MAENHYVFKSSGISDPIDTSWSEAQEWCNFVLFKPTWLPEGLTQISNTIRPESPDDESSHRAEFRDGNRILSIKQFLYDWAPPAYDHPSLWRNPKISTSENTSIPKAQLIGNNYLWFGLDYRRNPAAAINMLRTQVEITTLHGTFDDQEIVQIISSMAPVDEKAKYLILATSFAALMFNYRHPAKASDVPTSYFKHTRNKEFRCYPYPVDSFSMDIHRLPGYRLINLAIKNYRLDSLLLFGQNPQHPHEVQYCFESLIEPGSYMHFLVTKKDDEYAIQYPPKLGDQECHYSVHKLKGGEDIHHAWSMTNDRGSHSLVLEINDMVLNCIIKPAPWTTVNWARDVCTQVLNWHKDEYEL